MQGTPSLAAAATDRPIQSGRSAYGDHWYGPFLLRRKRLPDYGRPVLGLPDGRQATNHQHGNGSTHPSRMVPNARFPRKNHQRRWPPIPIGIQGILRKTRNPPRPVIGLPSPGKWLSRISCKTNEGTTQKTGKQLARIHDGIVPLSQYTIRGRGCVASPTVSGPHSANHVANAARSNKARPRGCKWGGTKKKEETSSAIRSTAHKRPAKPSGGPACPHPNSRGMERSSYGHRVFAWRKVLFPTNGRWFDKTSQQAYPHAHP